MKTSLILEDELFDSAKDEAQKTGKTISQVIAQWARAGRKTLKLQKKPGNFVPVDLGGESRVDLTKRSHWMDELDHDRN